MSGTPRNNTSVELITVYEVSKILSNSLDLQHMMRDVLRVLDYQMQMHRGRIYLISEDGAPRLVAAHALAEEQIEAERDPLREQFCARILRTEMPEAQQNADLTVACRIGVPIKATGRLLGVITIDRFGDDGSDAQIGTDLRFLTMVGNLIGQTVRLHRSVVEERSFQQREQARLQRLPPPTVSIAEVVYSSAGMREVLDQVQRVAPFKSTVLIRGESGTGKELIAQAIHNLSPRAEAPFVRVNCAALSESLLESELFGHDRGAFTGAHRDRKGRFEMAAGGTLFLDEIGDISPAFQAKLLRVLQEQEFERVGGSQTLRTDVRTIAATNANLEEAVGLGRFRADLYFRVNVVSITLPPLRERPEDIPILARHFVERFNRDNLVEIAIEGDAIDALLDQPWPGNVRELENCIERAATQCRDGIIRDSDLTGQLNLSLSSAFLLNRNLGAAPAPGVMVRPACPAVLSSACAHAVMPTDPALAAPRLPELVEVESVPESAELRERIVWALERSGWVQTKAARLLGLTTRQVRYALRKYNIDVKRF